MIKVTQSEEETVRGVAFSTGTYSYTVYSFRFLLVSRSSVFQEYNYSFSSLYEKSTISNMTHCFNKTCFSLRQA